MNKNNLRTLPLIGAAVLIALAGCSSLQADNAELMQARSDYRMADSNPQVRQLAPVELKLAGDALMKADKAAADREKPAEVTHLAYLAKQQTAVAQQISQQKAAELAVAAAAADRDKARLAARTNEADAAKMAADAALRQSEEAKRQAEMAQRQAAASNQAASDAQARNAQLESMLADMNAKKTERGMVVTIGDVLFDTNQAQLKPGGLRNIEKLSGFLKQYPQRTALVEGFTDSVGSDATNKALSSRRAEAVRSALVEMGVARERISTQGYGEAFPVAGNDSNSGRQLNRRVEVLLSDDKGVIVPR